MTETLIGDLGYLCTFVCTGNDLFHEQLQQPITHEKLEKTDRTQLKSGSVGAMISSSSHWLFLQLALIGLLMHGSHAADSCPRPDRFKAAVLIEHDGERISQVDENERIKLGEAFAATFDKMNSASFGSYCDKSFSRHTSSVRVDAQERYFIHADLPDHLGRQNFMYHIEGVCTNACPSHDLFADPSFSFERKLSDRELGLFEKTSVSTGSCTCPDDSTDRGPTEFEFMTEFNNVIAELFKNDHLKHIKTVNEVIDVAPFDCSDQEIAYTEDVHIELTKHIEDVDQEGVGLGFVDAYNLAAKHFCDDFGVYHVTSAVLEPVSEGTTRGRRLKNRLLKTNGKRRKKKQASTTDDGVRRRLEQVGTYTIELAMGGTQTVTTEGILKLRNEGTKFTIKSKQIGFPEQEAASDGEKSAKVKALDAGDKKKPEPDADGYTYGTTCYCPHYPIAFDEHPTDIEIAESFTEVLAFEKHEGVLKRTYRVRDLESGMKEETDVVVP